jgi:sucrose-6-phosphate hydrolase SacC (GH32 family)
VKHATRLAFALSALASASLASSAGAVDLTGTWEGSYTCQGFDGASFKAGNKTSTLLIFQNGTTFVANLDQGKDVYTGAVINDSSKPEALGEMVMNQCGTDPVPLAGAEGEIVRMKVKVDAAKGTGSLKGISILETPLPDVVTCKFKFKRINTTPGKFVTCVAG